VSGPLQAKRAAHPRNDVVEGRRWVVLDKWRGIAILCMIADHCALYGIMLLGGSVELGLVRVSIGRLAVPIFFVLAGYLCRRLTWRHLLIFGVGMALPIAVPTIDSPNVLCWWALGCFLIVVGRWCGVPLWVFAVAMMTGVANGWGQVENSYSPYGLWLLMLLGASWATFPPVLAAVGARMPGWVAWLGRHSVEVYVVHLLCLEAVYELVRG
jgi:surface polysaccharide O-acyltransferase-like enzyme